MKNRLDISLTQEEITNDVTWIDSPNNFEPKQELYLEFSKTLLPSEDTICLKKQPVRASSVYKKQILSINSGKKRSPNRKEKELTNLINRTKSQPIGLNHLPVESPSVLSCNKALTSGLTEFSEIIQQTFNFQSSSSCGNTTIESGNDDVWILSEEDLAALEEIEEKEINASSMIIPNTDIALSITNQIGVQKTITDQVTNPNIIQCSCHCPSPRSKICNLQYLIVKVDLVTMNYGLLYCVATDTKNLKTKFKMMECSIVKSQSDQNQISVSGESCIFSVLQKKALVYLFDDWVDSEVNVGDMMHLLDIGESLSCASSTGTQINDQLTFIQPDRLNPSDHNELIIHIHNHHGLLIVHPSILVSPTKVAESCACLRRAVLMERIKNFSPPSPAAVIGKVKHNFIQLVMEQSLIILNTAPSNPSIKTIADVKMQIERNGLSNLISRSKFEYLQELFLVGINDEQMEMELKNIFDQAVGWIVTIFYQGVQKLVSIDKAAYHSKIELDMRASKLETIEEMIWSSALGIKGQLDATLNCRYGVVDNQFLTDDTLHKMLFPIEFKTGKWKASTVISHRAQLILYILMITIREHSRKSGHNLKQNSRSLFDGLILYFNDRELRVDLIHPSWAEVRALILVRNSLAKALHSATNEAFHKNEIGLMKQLELPPMIQSANDCKYCYQAAECAMHHTAMEDGTVESSGVPSLFGHLLKGISANHIKYYKLWSQLIDLESKELKKKDNQAPQITFTLESYQKIDVHGIEKYELNLIQFNQPINNHSKRKPLSYRQNVDNVKPLKSIPIHRFRNEQNILENKENITNNSYLMKRKEITIQYEKNTTHILDQQQGERNDFNSIQTWFEIGDRIQISAMEYHSGPQSDIQNVKIASHADSIFKNVERNIETATVSRYSQQSMSIICNQTPYRLLNLFAINQENGKQASQHLRSTNDRLFLAIHKEDFSISIPTMRTNLLRLFLNPYRPDSFLDGLQLKKEADKKFNSTAPVANQKRFDFDSNRLRQLVVDLVEPTFDNIQFCSTKNVGHLLSPLKPTQRCINSYQITQEVTGALSQFGNQTQSASARYTQSAPKEDILLMCPTNIQRSCYLNSIKILSIYMKEQGNPGKMGASRVTKDSDGVLKVEGGLIVYPGCNPVTLFRQYCSLNVGQREAIQQMMLAKDYALLLGLPGTGKTSTISIFIRMLVARGSTVLVTSFTNSAVDHLLGKLIACGVSQSLALRLGNSQDSVEAVNDSLAPKDYLLNNSKIKSVLDTSRRLQNVRIMAGTVIAMSRSHLIQAFGKFDVCVVDEAGQIAQPLTLGAILHSNTFVLVGDDSQLSPLVVSKESKEGGMDISLFQRLKDAHPIAVTSLTSQYRMNEDIMLICNHLVYEYQMECASNHVANSKLFIPKSLADLTLPKDLGRLDSETCGKRKFQEGCDPKLRDDWLYNALDPSNSVVYVNTDGHCASNILNIPVIPGALNEESNTQSVLEVEIITTILKGLHHCGYEIMGHVGIITPFRSQVKLIRQSIRNTFGEMNDELCECSTVDRFQGKDSDIIIFSTVKGSHHNAEDGGETLSIGHILQDWRRINVAFTRAKLKLIVIGSMKTLIQAPIWKKFIDFCHQMKWIIDLSNYPSITYEWKNVDWNASIVHTSSSLINFHSNQNIKKLIQK